MLSPLLVRPLTAQSFEIVAGARRFRAAQIAQSETVPVRIVNLTDAEALEAQLIENLQRRDVHPLEAHGFRALLNLEEPTYNIEQVAAKTGKAPPTLPSVSVSPSLPQPWSRPSMPKRSASDTLSYLLSYSPTNKKKHWPSASVRNGESQATSPGASSYQSDIYNIGSSTGSCSS